MNEYELLYVISPRLTADEVDATVERVGALIEGGGGSVSMVDHWGRRRLAYPIRQHFEGAYVLTHCTLEAPRVEEIERALHLNENVLRHLLVRGVIPGYDGPPDQEVVETRRPAPPAAVAAAPPADAVAPADAEAAADGEPAADGAAAEGVAEPDADAAEPAAAEPAADAEPTADEATDAPAAEAVVAEAEPSAAVDEPPSAPEADDVPSPAPAAAE